MQSDYEEFNEHIYLFRRDFRMVLPNKKDPAVGRLNNQQADPLNLNF